MAGDGMTARQKCWCGRPINDPDGTECAEHDDVTTVRALIGASLPRILEPSGPLLRDEWSAGKPLTRAGRMIVEAVLPAVGEVLAAQRQQLLASVLQLAAEVRAEKQGGRS